MYTEVFYAFSRIYQLYARVHGNKKSKLLS